MSTPRGTAFLAMFDDAAMFPPGNASASEGLAEHLRLRGSSHHDLIGPLLVPALAWDDFRAAHQAAGSPYVQVVLVGASTIPEVVPTEITVSGYEVAVADIPLPETSRGGTLAAEISIGAGGGRVLAAVAEQAAAGRSVVAKFRTGGTSAEAFPSEQVLSRVIVDAVAVGAPMKLTAGLHHAIRFADPVTGFEHHGFLNVLVAFAAAIEGADADLVSGVLAEQDGNVVVQAFLELAPARADAARRAFVSFGCCGVEDPIGDLATLGLLD